MAAASRSDQSRQCKDFGHHQREWSERVMTERPKQDKMNTRNSDGGVPLLKWYPHHMVKTQSEAEYHKQREITALHFATPSKSDQAQYALIGTVHLTQTPEPGHPTFGYSFSAVRNSPAQVTESTV